MATTLEARGLIDFGCAKRYCQMMDLVRGSEKLPDFWRGPVRGGRLKSEGAEFSVRGGEFAISTG